MKRCIITGILLFVLCSHAHGAAVRELNLEGLCRSAGTIFWGVCTGVETQDEALVYTFAAHRMLKGGSADTVTLRMHKAASMYARAPRFAEGQEVLLFLYPESDLGYSLAGRVRAGGVHGFKPQRRRKQRLPMSGATAAFSRA